MTEPRKSSIWVSSADQSGWDRQRPDAPVQASTDLRFASAVAAFGQKLRGGTYTGSFGYDQIIDLANGAKGTDAFGYRAAFVQLVRQAKSLDTGG